MWQSVPSCCTEIKQALGTFSQNLLYFIFFPPVKLRFFSNRLMQLLWQQSLLSLRVINFHAQGLEMIIKWCSTFCHLLLQSLCFDLAEQPQQTDCWCTKWEHLFHEQRENRVLQAPWPAELFSGYYAGKKPNRTFQQRLKLIAFIWNNVIYFCQSESFRASTACLRVPPVLKTLPRQIRILFQ